MRDRWGRRASIRESQCRDGRRRDRGQTFVEVLVSIVLLGTAVGGTLTALRTTIVSTEVDDGLAKADAWLHEAEAALHLAPYVPCTTPSAVESAYRSVIQLVPPPDGWAGGVIDLASVQFWGRNTTPGPTFRHEGWRSSCIPDPFAPFVAQRIEFYVLSPNLEVGRRIQVVKGG